MIIDNFKEEYYFLSNFYETPVYYNGLTYRSSEVAFQAQKTLDNNTRKKFINLNPRHSKRLGKKVELRNNWNKIKTGIMAEIVHAKFTQHPELIEKLLLTSDATLIEGNTWHDNYYGSCVCDKCVNKEGKNHLGKILMEERKYWKYNLI